ncbi:L-type lectin-domain containing receptor kinase S.1-like [Salvia splendens]|uniref:L-type lectin-domain containing receptor kinase S.1-like n=1 Tax=Salvia splendens TaxID=180675 RepID=UPI001C271B2C|nr:L-type lectin-domain containing receptor kinase S.1-like [Salvia splendens]
MQAPVAASSSFEAELMALLRETLKRINAQLWDGILLPETMEKLVELHNLEHVSESDLTTLVFFGIVWFVRFGILKSMFGASGRLGDFGLAKLYTHGQVPSTTRVEGMLGYLAPEVVTLASPTAASDVYSFGIVVMEVACGRKPIETRVEDEDQEVLIDWVRHKYVEGRILKSED